MFIHALFSVLCFSFQVRKNKPFHTFMLMTLRVGKKKVSQKMQCGGHGGRHADL